MEIPIVLISYKSTEYFTTIFAKCPSCSKGLKTSKKIQVVDNCYIHLPLSFMQILRMALEIQFLKKYKLSLGTISLIGPGKTIINKEILFLHRFQIVDFQSLVQ